MLTTSIRITEELRRLFDAVVRPLGNVVTVVTTESNGHLTVSGFDEMSKGVHEYAREILVGLYEPGSIDQVVCFIADPNALEEPKHVFSATGFDEGGR